MIGNVSGEGRKSAEANGFGNAVPLLFVVLITLVSPLLYDVSVAFSHTLGS